MAHLKCALLLTSRVVADDVRPKPKVADKSEQLFSHVFAVTTAAADPDDDDDDSDDDHAGSRRTQEDDEPWWNETGPIPPHLVRGHDHLSVQLDTLHAENLAIARLTSWSSAPCLTTRRMSSSLHASIVGWRRSMCHQLFAHLLFSIRL